MANRQDIAGHRPARDTATGHLVLHHPVKDQQLIAGEDERAQPVPEPDRFGRHRASPSLLACRAHQVQRPVSAATGAGLPHGHWRGGDPSR